TQAQAMPITLSERDKTETVRADFFAEEVRRELAAMYGSPVLYEGGLTVKTTVRPDYQDLSDRALRKALREYDHRWGYRGPLGKLETLDGWADQLAIMPHDNVVALEGEHLAVALSVGKDSVSVGLDNGEKGTVPFEHMKWARKSTGHLSYGATPS